MGSLIVTGASRGIGEAVAKLAAQRGFAVAVNYTQDRAGAESVVRTIAAAGGRATAIAGDVSKEEDVKRLFDEATNAHGPIRALVSNAGITGGLSRVEDLASSVLERVLAVNVVGVFLCGREAVRRMSTRRGGAGGVIVNVSSLAAKYGGAGDYVHYAASKAAVDAFTIGLAREVAADGIRVNGVQPGFIQTGIHAAMGAPERLERAAKTVPMQRVGAPEEVAESIVWLLSPASSYVTGAILEVGGGR
jgi:NAD(P)-dependent dehydrogenase (short-subunit alcohol dehydrogenase family)